MTRERIVVNQKVYHRTQLVSFQATKVVDVDINAQEGSRTVETGAARKRKPKFKPCIIS